MNSRDLFEFCSKQQLKLEEFERNIRERKWHIFLDGEVINARYHKKSKKTTFEFGGFFNYSGNSKKLLLMRKLMQLFSNRSCSVSRIDYAVDVKHKWAAFHPTFRSIEPKLIGSSLYYNEYTRGTKKKKLSTLTVYDKGLQLKMFSIPLTRIEIRVFRHNLKRMGCDKLLESQEMLIRIADFIYEQLENQLKLYSTDCSCICKLQTDAISIFENFIAFIHGTDNELKTPDIFRVKNALMQANKIRSWLEKEGIPLNDIKKNIKGKKLSICKDIGVDVKTLNKAIEYYKSIPQSQL